MFGDLLKSASKWLGLGKKDSNLGGLFNKAKNFVGKGLNFLRSAPVKNVVQSVSQYIPSARSYYDDAKKYGSIASNLMNGGLQKKAERFIKKEKPAPTIERVPRVEFRRPGMFEEPRESMAML